MYLCIYVNPQMCIYGFMVLCNCVNPFLLSFPFIIDGYIHMSIFACSFRPHRQDAILSFHSSLCHITMRHKRVIVALLIHAHLFVYLLIYLFVDCFIRVFIALYVYLLLCMCIYCFVCCFLYWFIDVLIYLFIYVLIS